MRVRESHVLGIAALLTPVIGVLEPLGLAPLLVISAVGTLGFRLAYDRNRPWQPKPLIALLALFAAWGLASALWSIDPAATLHKFPLLAGALLCGAMLADSAAALEPGERTRLMRLLCIGVMTGFAILIVERVANFPYRRLEHPTLHRDLLLVSYNRGATVLAMLIWPVALALWRKRPLYAALLPVSALAVLAFYPSGATHAAIIIGTIVAALALIRPRAAAPVLGACMIVYIATAPLIHARLIDANTFDLKLQTNDQLNSTIVPLSGFHRLLIWHFTSGKIQERPILGWGLESSRYIPGGKTLFGPIEPALPLHPHNGVLQIWLELGIVGAAFFAGLVAWTLATIRSAPWPTADKAAVLALVTAAFIILNLSYGIWQGWWMAALFLAASFGIGSMSVTAAPQREKTVALRPVSVNR